MKTVAQCPCGAVAPPSRKLCNHCRFKKAELAARVNLCECGCGTLVSRRFEAGHQTRLLPREEQARRGRLNDGSKQRNRGSGKWYRKVGGKHEHRVLMEKKLGRKLLPSEIVHHKNRDKRSNEDDNLEVMTRAEHIAEHRRELVEGLRRAAA